MAIIATYQYIIYRADTDSRFIDFFEDEAKQGPFALADFPEWKMEVRRDSVAAPVITLQLGAGLSISNTNRMTFTISKTLAEVKAGNYLFDLEGNDPSGARETILAGDFIIQQDITT